jgi:PAS domain-containing protein
VAAETHGVQRRGEPLGLRSVTNTIPSLVVCALSDGSVEFVNQSWWEYTGFSLEHLAPWRGRLSYTPTTSPSSLMNGTRPERLANPSRTKLVCGVAMANIAGSR